MYRPLISYPSRSFVYQQFHRVSAHYCPLKLHGFFGVPQRRPYKHHGFQGIQHQQTTCQPKYSCQPENAFRSWAQIPLLKRYGLFFDLLKSRIHFCVLRYQTGGLHAPQCLPLWLLQVLYNHMSLNSGLLYPLNKPYAKEGRIAAYALFS